MIVCFKNEKHPYVLIFDIEFDKEVLIEFAAVLFQKIAEDLYAPCRTINQYVSHIASYPFQKYTGLTSDFLIENGIGSKDLVQLVEDEFLKDIPLSELLVVSHGLKNDRIVLDNNFINFKYDRLTMQPIDGYCTFNNARRILKRQDQLKLGDIAKECGFYPINEHNAYSDVWSTVAIFSYLRAME